ncbi:MAG TPA: MBL fold metallo-hydrolase [Clostridia bacterium]|nr:MBL fold metallo-hydrolase [Clostridia bacterium]
MLLLSICGVAQQYTTNTSLTTSKLAENVYLIQGEGGNVTALIGEDAILLIDSMFPETAAGLDAALKSLSPKPVRYVINTHWHADHTGANEYFGGRGATIVSSEPTRAWLASRGNDYRPNAKAIPTPTAGLPVVAFGEDSTSISAANACSCVASERGTRTEMRERS